MNENKPKIEICLESIESVIAAQRGNADRVEFCSDLFEGGLTPSLGAFQVAKEKTSIQMSVMIRPRGGDFCYSDYEFEAMKKDVVTYKNAGADVIVFGILTPEGHIDEARSKEIISLASPLPVTFHRAFDMCVNLKESLEVLITLGVQRVLTSGGEATVSDGAKVLRDLVIQAGERIIIMPGSGINERNFAHIHSLIHAKEYHLSLLKVIESKMKYRPDHIYMGGMLRQPEFLLTHTDAARVEKITSLL